jgi:hypothetical protein
VQSVWQLAAGWTTEGWEFQPQWVKNILASKSSRTVLGFAQSPESFQIAIV